VASPLVWLPTKAGDDDPFLTHLRRALDDDVELLAAPDLPAGGDPRVLVAGVPTDEQLAGCSQLEHLVIPYAGVPPQTRARMQARPEVQVHNLHHNAAPTAELAVGLLLACAKEIVPYDRALRSGDWRARYAKPTTATLAGGHAVVLGYGAIGQRVAHVLTSLAMRVSAVRRSAQPGDRHGMVALEPLASLPRLLRTADAVVICLPLTTATEGLLDAALLRLLPRTAYVVNVGRGALVEERALYEALAEGRLAGAGLDVWYRYPRTEDERGATPPSAFPFDELDNVVMSPHRAGQTRQVEQARARALAAVLRAVKAGTPVPNRVDLAHGY